MISTKFTDLPGAVDVLANQYALALSQKNLDDLAKGLSILSTRAGTLLLTGHATPFVDLTVEQREACLQSWSSSRLALLRSVFRGIVGELPSLFGQPQSTSLTLPFIAVALYKVYTDFPEMIAATDFPTSGDPDRAKDAARVRKHQEFKFEKVMQDYQYIDTDVLICGSGAGGGVVASEMAEKGWSTLVVEKGIYQRPEEMTTTPKDGFANLYEGQGLMATEDGSMNVLAGSSFGGGTVSECLFLPPSPPLDADPTLLSVNWSASLRPQHFLREQWAKAHGLPYFLSAEFARSVEFVCKRMGVSPDHLKHNAPNSLLVDASVKLGYPVANIPVRLAIAEHPSSC